jgi:hypothetical protein
MLDHGRAPHSEQLSFAFLYRKLPDVANVATAGGILLCAWQTKTSDKRIAGRSLERTVDSRFLGVTNTTCGQSERGLARYVRVKTDGATADCLSSANGWISASLENTIGSAMMPTSRAIRV